jgi:hypothetical protein
VPETDHESVQVAQGQEATAPEPAPSPAAARPPGGAAPEPGGSTVRFDVPNATKVTALSSAAPASAGGLTVSAHAYVNPPRTGTHKEDYWTQLQLWGEITNETSDVLETASARVFFYDTAGKEIGIDSIGTASQKDAGDHEGGERFYAEVRFIEPGGSVPFHFMRNLDAIKGEVASIELRAGTANRASGPVPKPVVVDLVDAVVGEKGLEKRTFKGKIRNDGDGPCRAPDLVLAFRDADGKVASTETLLTGVASSKKLARGETIDFDTRAYVHGDDAWRASAKVELLANCKSNY